MDVCYNFSNRLDDDDDRTYEVVEHRVVGAELPSSTNRIRCVSNSSQLSVDIWREYDVFRSHFQQNSMCLHDHIIYITTFSIFSLILNNQN